VGTVRVVIEKKRVDMELGFILQATRRYLWVVVIATMLGLVAGSVIASGGGVEYESQGLLSVEPPQGVNPDRYVATQLVRLTSTGVTEAVAALPTVPLEPIEVRESLTLTQIAGTDVVEVVAQASTPEVAQAIAQGYIDVYLEQLQADLRMQLAPQRAQLQASISSLEEDLEAVDAEVETLTEPFLEDRAVGIPTLDQLNPALATRRAALTQEYQRLLTELNNFDRTANGDVSSRMLEAPGLPIEPVISRRPLFLAVGLVLGLLTGVALASMLARLSPFVVNRSEAEDILGGPFVGSIARRRSLAAPLDEIVFGPALNVAAIRQLSVRAQSYVYEGAPLSVLVTGSRHVSGTSTVAALVAQHFAYQGNGVMIVDADVTTPDLSGQVGTEDVIPVDELIGAGTPARAKRSSASFRRQSGDEIAVAGFHLVGDRRPQLSSVSALVAGAVARAEVVVVDGGPLMGSASTVQLSRECDVVIVAVPVSRQKAHDLRLVRDQLAESGRPVLSVSTPSLRKRKAGPARPPALDSGDPAITPAEPAGAAR
jgi:Mrp family chromosome partitioning ATPase/capsular polysaccharide biosynthesis protein